MRIAGVETFNHLLTTEDTKENQNQQLTAEFAEKRRGRREENLTLLNSHFVLWLSWSVASAKISDKFVLSAPVSVNQRQRI